MNSMLPIKSFLLNGHLESLHLLNMETRVGRLVLFKQFVMDNTLPVPPYVHHLMQMKMFHERCSLFAGAKPFLP